MQRATAIKAHANHEMKICLKKTGIIPSEHCEKGHGSKEGKENKNCPKMKSLQQLNVKDFSIKHMFENGTQEKPDGLKSVALSKREFLNPCGKT